MTKRIDLTGRRFGKLTVLEIGELRSGTLHWICQCDCGTVKQINGRNMRNGKSKSCGCTQFAGFDTWNDEQRQRALENPVTRRRPDGYAVWLSMKDRCYNANNKKFDCYGGRGIVVSDEWRASFEAFIRDMGPRPEPGYEIDRIDNDGNYENGNCRWVPRVVNANNKRNNRVLLCAGHSLTASEWARATGIKQHTILARIDTLGWSVEQALTTPVQRRRAA